MDYERYEPYVAMQEAKDAWLSDNPGKSAKDWEYAGTHIQDEYVEPIMNSYGYHRQDYMGYGVWMYAKS
jgi:hypothetical protein